MAGETAFRVFTDLLLPAAARVLLRSHHMPEVKETPVNICSATEVKHWIEGKKRSGEFRRCAHLKTFTRKVGTSSISWRVEFLPWCERLSFKWTIEAYGDQAAQREILANYLGRHKVVSCPANCAFYEHETRVAWKQKVGAVGKLVWRQAVGAFRWFHSLAWQIQLALIVLAVVALSPKWVPPIVTLLKAFHGQ